VRFRADDAQTVSVDRAGLVGQPRYMVRELLIAVWQRRDWPLQAMGYAQWEHLAEMLLPGDRRTGEGPEGEGVPEKHMFPGSISAESSVEGLRLTSQPC
jgi:hypothetical protein